MILGDIMPAGAKAAHDVKCAHPFFAFLCINSGPEQQIDSTPNNLGARNAMFLRHRFDGFDLSFCKLDLRSNHNSSSDNTFAEVMTQTQDGVKRTWT